VGEGQKNRRAKNVRKRRELNEENTTRSNPGQGGTRKGGTFKTAAKIANNWWGLGTEGAGPSLGRHKRPGKTTKN